MKRRDKRPLRDKNMLDAPQLRKATAAMRDADGTRLKKDRAVIDVIDNGKRVWYVAAVAEIAQSTLRRWVAAEREARAFGNLRGASLQSRQGALDELATKPGTTVKDLVRAADLLGGSLRPELTPMMKAPPAVDAINPAHYRMGAIEVIDAIESWQLGFHLGNAIKYIARAGRKDPTKTVEDLKKSRWYLDRAITNAQKVKP